ncbi:hypothetical protein ACJ41O_010213 [Fusarium nematophilum]
MEADYNKYLSSIYPNTSWSVVRLSGGLVNTTVRATQTSPSNAGAPQSVILKHAKPYVEVAGPEWAFSTKRQETEAILLNFFSQEGVLFPLREPSYWNSPQCLNHQEGTESTLGLTSSDTPASVLVLNDLGNLVNIFDFLVAHSRRPQDEVEPKVAKLGRDMGTIFASIHSPETVSKVQASDPQAAAKLSLPITADVVYIAAVEPLRFRLRGYANAEKLLNRVKADFYEPDTTYPPSLTIGDFTQGSILMRFPGHDDDWTPTLVDWEFGQLNGRGANGDMAQFLAHLQCEIISLPLASSARRILSDFATSFCTGYADRADLRFRKDLEDQTLRLLRGAFITHGREMVNQAWERYEGNEKFEEMWSKGVWYLERAGDGMREFLEEQNWAKIELQSKSFVRMLFKEV